MIINPCPNWADLIFGVAYSFASLAYLYSLSNTSQTVMFAYNVMLMFNVLMVAMWFTGTILWGCYSDEEYAKIKKLGYGIPCYTDKQIDAPREDLEASRLNVAKLALQPPGNAVSTPVRSILRKEKKHVRFDPRVVQFTVAEIPTTPGPVPGRSPIRANHLDIVQTQASMNSYFKVLAKNEILYTAAHAPRSTGFKRQPTPLPKHILPRGPPPSIAGERFCSTRNVTEL